MTAILVSESPPSVVTRRQSSARSAAWRAAFVGSVALVGAFVWQFGSQHAQAPAEPELALLMRGMAVIKGCLAVLALALVLWRLSLPVAGKVAIAYAACLWLLFASSVLVWFQVSVPGAAVLFHAGELALLLVAWREGFPIPRFGRQEPNPSIERTPSGRPRLPAVTAHVDG